MSFCLLVSTKADKSATRQYAYFTNKEDLSQAIIQHYEDFLNDREKERLTKLGLTDIEQPCVEYTSDDLWQFIDSFYAELVCLVKEEGFDDLWIPQSPDWIKETIQISLRVHYSKKLERDSLQNGGTSSMDMDII